MSLIIGLFDNKTSAYTAMNALTDLGLDPAADEIEEVSSKTIAEDYTEMEQHPEAHVPGSVQSLGAPTPPPSTDPTLSAGPIGQAYLDKGQDGVMSVLSEAGFDRSTAARAAQMVENGGALVIVHTTPDGEGAKQALTHAGALEILG